MKRIWSIILIVLALVFVFPICVFAADESQSYQFELTADGQTNKNVRKGDIITVSLYLNRTDANEDYTMYSMQDEIRYDGNFFEFVEGSEMLANGVQATDISVNDGYREFYMNFLSLVGGESWKARKQIGSFQLRVIAESGSSKITHQDYLVALPDAGGSYACEANALTFTVSSNCTLSFATNGGSEISEIENEIGTVIDLSEYVPTRYGFIFEGWYSDEDLTEKIESIELDGDTTIYAKWRQPSVNNQIYTPSYDEDLDFSWVIWVIVILLVIIIIVMIL